MDALEVLAVIFAVLVLVKFAALLISPVSWMNTAGAMLKYPRACTWVYAVLRRWWDTAYSPGWTSSKWFR